MGDGSSSAVVIALKKRPRRPSRMSARVMAMARCEFPFGANNQHTIEQTLSGGDLSRQAKKEKKMMERKLDVIAAS
ncbi:hypothetical protein CK222_30150 [Mesorhizobium sp. WSM3866]|nr:hypothetical protein CK222_30150 [Mesorhizobium sp. WSM3866]